MRITLIGTLALIAIFGGCGDFNRAELSAQHESRVIREFASNPYRAKEKYMNLWTDNPIRASQMVIAAEMMDADPDNYERYYRYVTKGLSATDQDVVTAAIRAMRSSRGQRSLQILFDLYGRNKGDLVSRTAEDSIRSRYITAMHTPDLNQEVEAIRKFASRSGLALQ